MQIPKVSVIIITYNRAQLLRTAGQTVLDQTFQDFELLIVDDGSSDDTGNTIKSFNDPRVRYVKHAQNQGEGGARNTGMQHAKGEYIAFLDDDDEWLPNKLQLQVELLDSQPGQVGLVHSALINFCADTDEEKERRRPIGQISGKVFDRCRAGQTASATSTSDCCTASPMILRPRGASTSNRYASTRSTPSPMGLFYSAIFAKSRELAEALPVWRDSTTSG